MNKELVVNEKGDIKIFENPEFGRIRVVNRDNEPWFVLKDVCKALGLTNPSVVAERLDEDERAKFDLGRQGEANIINESGLYNVILRSEKEEAKQFRRWVTHEILPSIRKHGAYMTNEFIDKVISNPDLIIRMATELKQQREENQLLLEEKRGLEVKIEQDKPLVDLASSIIAHDFDITMSEMGNVLSQNGLKMGQNKLFTWMRNNDYLISSGECRNNPQQWAVDKGYLKLVTKTYRDKNGIIVPYNKTYITPKGQMHLVQKLLKQRDATLS